MTSNAALPSLEQALTQDLTARYGHLVSGDDLRRTLGYKSSDAFRQAIARKTLPVTVFSIPHRRGKFALSSEIARWLAVQHEAARRTEPAESEASV